MSSLAVRTALAGVTGLAILALAACTGPASPAATPTTPPAAATAPAPAATPAPAPTPAPKTVETAVPKPSPAAPPAPTPAPKTAPDGPAAGAALASCIVGTWEVPDLDAYFRSVFEQTGATLPGGPVFQGTSGTMRYTFGADGTGRGDVDLTARVSIQGIQATMTMKGAPTARYRVTGPGTIQIDGNSGEDLRITLTLAGTQVINNTVASLFGAPGSATSNAAVTCNGNQMTIQVTDVANTPVTPLRRVS